MLPDILNWAYNFMMKTISIGFYIFIMKNKRCDVSHSIASTYSAFNFIAFWWWTGLLQVCNCKEGFLWKRPWPWVLRENPFGSVTEKIQTHEGIKSNQVKHLGIIECFNVSWKVATKWLLTESGYYMCHFMKSKVMVWYALST